MAVRGDRPQPVQFLGEAIANDAAVAQMGRAIRLDRRFQQGRQFIHAVALLGESRIQTRLQCAEQLAELGHLPQGAGQADEVTRGRAERADAGRNPLGVGGIGQQLANGRQVSARSPSTPARRPAAIRWRPRRTAAGTANCGTSGRPCRSASRPGRPAASLCGSPPESSAGFPGCAEKPDRFADIPCGLIRRRL